MFYLRDKAPAATRDGRPAGAGAAVMVVALALLAGTAAGDRIVTKSGETFTGTVVSEDKDKVVLKTLSGTMTILRDTIKTLEKTGEEAKPPSSPPQVVVVPVDPAKAAQAMADAKAAVAAGEWIKAAGLLEGLLLLDEKAFSVDDRLAATGALTICYLQIKDPQGAAKTLTRRALLATDPSDKRRLLAAAEALRTANSVQIGGKTVSRFEDLLQAAMNWKADQVLAEARDLATRAVRLMDAAQLERYAAGCQKKLAEADVFVPGYSAAHKKEPLMVLVTGVIDGAKDTVEYCTKERQELTRVRTASVFSKPAAKAFNDRAGPYLARRQVAEEALKNLKNFTSRFEMAAQYAANEAAVKDFLEKLDDLQYYPEGTTRMPYYGYGNLPPSGRLRIQLRQF